MAMRTFTCEFDLREPEHIFGIEGYSEALVLVRRSGRPLGLRSIQLDPRQRVLTRDELLAAAAPLANVAVEEDRPVQNVPITIAIVTRSRPYALRRCLRAVRGLRYAEYEVLILDCGYGNPARPLAEEFGARYVAAEGTTTGEVRQRAADAAHHDVLALLADGARPDALWLQGICAGFSSGQTAAVTGLVLPDELSYPSQHILEAYGRACRSFQRGELNARRLAELAMAGAAENIAVHRRRTTFEGGALGPLYNALEAGLQVQCEPGALVWVQHTRHLHRARTAVAARSREYAGFVLRNGDGSRGGYRAPVWRAMQSLWRRRHGWPLGFSIAELLGAASARNRRWVV
jgi:hypothetical protein